MEGKKKKKRNIARHRSGWWKCYHSTTVVVCVYGSCPRLANERAVEFANMIPQEKGVDRRG
jgi:hypothetical protein